MSTHSHPTHACCKSNKNKGKRVWWIVGTAFLFGALSSLIPPLKPFSKAFWDYLHLVAWPLGAGLLVGGVMDRFMPKEYVAKLLARPRKQTIFYATGLGVLASACSHGILALSMELHKKGASGPAVVSFLLASPWANFPVTLLLIGLFSWKGLLIIFAAVSVALTIGLIFQFFDEKGWIEKNRHTPVFDSSFSIRSDLKKRWGGYRLSFSQLKADGLAVTRGAVELSEMILGWVIFGIVLASAVQAYVPTHFFHSYMGPNFIGLLATLAFASILEVCSEGTAPLAFEIYRQTHALGNSFVFLSAGVLTDYTEIGLIWSNLGRRTAFWMVVLGVPQILLWGYLFNLFF